MDCNLPDSSVHGILQVRILEWVAFPSPGDLPDPGIEPRSPALQEDSLPTESPGHSQFFTVIFSVVRAPFKIHFLKWSNLVKGHGRI